MKFNDKREQAEAVEMTERTEILEMIMSMKCLRTLNTMSAEGKARKAQASRKEVNVRVSSYSFRHLFSFLRKENCNCMSDDIVDKDDDNNRR